MSLDIIVSKLFLIPKKDRCFFCHFQVSFFFLDSADPILGFKLADREWRFEVKTFSPKIFIQLNPFHKKRVFHKKAVIKSFTIFTGRHLCQSVFFCSFIKKRPQHNCFLLNIAKFLKAPILKNICKRVLLIPAVCWVSSRNQSFDLQCISNDWYLYDLQHYVEMDLPGTLEDFPISRILKIIKITSQYSKAYPPYSLFYGQSLSLAKFWRPTRGWYRQALRLRLQRLRLIFVLE